MRVVLVPASSDPVGVATHTLNLAQLLDGAGILECVLCPKDGWLTEQLRAAKLPYETLGISHHPLNFIRSSFRLFLSLRRRPAADTVHLHGRFPLFVATLSMLLEGKRRRFVATVHEFASTGSLGFFRWKLALETMLLRRMTNVCCVSRALKEEVVSRLTPHQESHVHMIPNWVIPTTSGHHRIVSEESGFVNVCGVGRLSREKGFDILIDAVKILTTRNVRVKCDVFGSGPEEHRLAACIYRYGLNGVVKLRGQVPGIRGMLASYDVVVIPSRKESFGIVALEAYDAGVPVVASDIPGLNEVVNDSDTGLLFPIGNAEALADCIQRVAIDEELRSKVIQNGKRRLGDYSPSNTLLARFIDLYSGTSQQLPSDSVKNL